MWVVSIGAGSMCGLLALVQSICVCYDGCSQLGCAMLDEVSSQHGCSMLGAVSSQHGCSMLGAVGLGVLWWVQSAVSMCGLLAWVQSACVSC